MKTVREHLDTLKPEHRNIAYMNLSSDRHLDTKVMCLTGVFELCICYEETELDEVYDQLEAGNYHFTADESAERMATQEELESITPSTGQAIFPEDDAERQKYAVGTFICEFFPHAIAELARFSYDMQQKHNPDAPMGWAKGKSVGDGNQIFRHQMDGEFREVAWRGLEQLERFLTKMEPFND